MCKKAIFAALVSSICFSNAVTYAARAGIIGYDVDMDILARGNAVRTRARCTIRNDGAAELRHLDIEAARLDLVAFLDWVAESNDPRRSPVYPGLLCRDSGTQWGQLNRILQSMTGRTAASHQQWRRWWQGAREDFQPAQRAQQLGPGGLQAAHAG